MLLPIGHDSGTVRRQPWVTYALMLACVGLFLATNGDRSRIEAAYEERLRESVELLVESPWLEPPAALQPVLGPDWQAQRRELVALLAQAGREPDVVERAELQARLDGLVAEADALREAHPFLRLGLVPSAPRAAGWLGHMFLHAGWLHLLGNLLLLFLTAPFVEDRWGRPGFLAFYLVAGLAAAGLFVARFPGLEVPLVGASGAVAGCMGAFLVRFFRTRLRYFYWFGIFVGTFSAPAWLMLPIWFANELAMAKVSEAVAPLGGAGVAYWAHVGGFAFGALAAAAVRALRLEERFLDERLESKVTVVRTSPRVADAVAAEAEGRVDEAFGLLAQEVRRSPRDRDAAEALWRLAVDHGRVAEAAVPYLRAVRETVRAGDAAHAVGQWLEFSAHARSVPVEPDLLLRLAPLLAGADQPAAAREALERLLATPGIAASQALRAARVARDLDADLCVRAAHAARAARDAGPEERAQADALLAQLGGGPRASRATEPPALGALERAQIALEPDLGPPSGAGLFAGESPLAGHERPELDIDEATRHEPARGGDGERETAIEYEPTLPVLELQERETAVGLDDDDDGPGAAPRGLFDDDDDLDAVLGDADSFAAELRDEADEADAEPAPATEVWSEPVPAAAPSLRPLRVVEAAPLGLGDGVLSLDVAGRGKTRLRLERIEAVAVAAVRGLGREKPVLVVDLALGWKAGAGTPLQVIRMRGDRFDPRRLDPAAASPLAALRGLVAKLLDDAGAAALPDRRAALGEPRFADFADLASYEREVLLAAAAR
jgi:membrane associated rhomboid family serine protease